MDTTVAPAVARVRRPDGTTAVVKLCPDADDAVRETLALDAWRRTGLVPGARRIEPDVLLLDDLGGRTLTELGLSGAEHARDAGGMLRRLRRRSPAGTRPVEEVLAEIDRWNAEFGLEADVLAVAQEASRELRALEADPWLVHGDFQPNNVLWTDAGLRVIDPGGLRGSPAFDLAQYAVNVAGDQTIALGDLVAGYGERPRGLDAWFAFLAVNLYRIAQIPRLGAGWRLVHIGPLVARLVSRR